MKNTKNRKYRFLFLLPILIGLILLIPTTGSITTYRMLWCKWQTDKVEEKISLFREQEGRLPKELSEISHSFNCGQSEVSQLIYEATDDSFKVICSAHIPIVPHYDGISGLIEGGDGTQYPRYTGISGLIDRWASSEYRTYDHIYRLGYQESDPIRESYSKIDPNEESLTVNQAISTFSIDVDTASYSNVRRFLNDGQFPPSDAVRVEELINYHRYNYPDPTSNRPLSISTDLGPCPWSEEHQLLRVGLQAENPPKSQEPSRNLVFLVDVSGSMNSPDKLPLLRKGLTELVDTLKSDDLVSLVVYAGAAGVVLEPTSGANKKVIKNAISQLESGGSTNGASGILRAYELARENFEEDSVNRVILASDGDFNVGLDNHSDLIRLIESQRASGIYLSVLGFGKGNLNDHLMEQLADYGNGNYAYIDSIEESRRALVKNASSTFIPVADDVKIQIEFDPKQVLSWRQVGYENRQLETEDFEDDRKDAGELGAGHQVTAMYEVRLRPGPRLFLPVGKVAVRYKEPGQKVSKSFSGLFFLFGEPAPDYWLAASIAEFGLHLQGDSRASLIGAQKNLDKARGQEAGDFPKLLTQATRVGHGCVLER